MAAYLTHFQLFERTTGSSTSSLDQNAIKQQFFCDKNNVSLAQGFMRSCSKLDFKQYEWSE